MVEYIEREALLAHIKDLPTWWADAGGVYGRRMKYPEGMFDCEDVISSVENAPAADVAPVQRGQWTDRQGGFWGVATCSICGEKFPTGEIGLNYCPNCGAKMDGETEGNDG